MLAMDRTPDNPPAQGSDAPAPRTPRGARGSTPAAKRAPAYPAAVDRLIGEFNRLPGIGRRSAERLAFYILKSDASIAAALAGAVTDVKRTVHHCPVCSNLTDAPVCPICSDDSRDRTTVLVVEQPKDLIALEQTGMYRGLYHVLMGRLSPLDGIGPGDLTVSELLRRVDHPEKNAGQIAVVEIILGLNPTIEGDGTSLYLAQEFKGKPVKVSRLARGLPAGSPLEFANKAVLADAITCRQSVD